MVAVGPAGRVAEKSVDGSTLPSLPLTVVTFAWRLRPTTSDTDLMGVMSRPQRRRTSTGTEPPRVFRRLFGLSHAAMAG